MHGHTHELLSFLVLLVGSLIAPMLSGRLGLPSAILLILFGFGVGPNALDLVADDKVTAFLSEVGFIVLMFMAGLEIDFHEIGRRGRSSILMMLVICLLIFALAFLAAVLLGLSPIFALALGATSVGLPLAILNETGQLRTELGQTVVLVGSLGEFLTVIGMTLFYFASRYGFSMELVVGLGKLLGVLLAAGLTLKTMMAAAWWWPRRLRRLNRRLGSAELGVRAALLLMMAFSMMALIAGVEAIVGAFIAGAVISFVFRGKHVLEEKLAVVGHGLFVPIFFIVVGVRFRPEAITDESLQTAGLLLVAALLVKLLPSLGLLKLGLGLRDTAGTALLLSAPLTLVVAIAALGLDLSRAQPPGQQVLDASGESALIVLAVASGILFPVLFRVLFAARSPKPRG